jgi:hypothetical protein
MEAGICLYSSFLEHNLSQFGTQKYTVTFNSHKNNILEELGIEYTFVGSYLTN